MTTLQLPTLRDDSQWYRDAIIYELHIRAFRDSNGDGIGDLPGLIEKLDYLVDLGVTAIWLLPFYPSPLRDGGYDIADYAGVHEHYGTRADVARLLDEAHRRGLRVITELVLNHTSAEHPWFQRARRAPKGSPERDFYVWNDDPHRYQHTRIIFQDFETSNWSWDPVAGAYYWHRFYAHQPDLNFDNPAVHDALFEVIDLWFGMGVDGMRLDAVPYLYEREGTSCENLPETHAFLKKLRAHVDGKFKNKMLLAEANQWPADAAAYFGDGDECHMNFHFPLMPRMYIAIEQEDSFPIVNILRRTPPIPESCQWATFLRNHDELTLEMVTDEDRDSMYRAYAAERHARINLGIRRRLAPLMQVRRKIELMNALLLSLPGTPVLYYGDEIGMGDNIYLGDRDGVRTPMQWSSDRNAGFSRANPQRLYLPAIIDPEYHYEAINVESQQASQSSLLWWTKRMLAKRKEFRVFGRGSINFIGGDNPRVLAFVREHAGERVLVIANLSRYVQAARLEMRALSGNRPVEVFGRMHFPRIAETPYFVCLGPHDFYWLALEPADLDTQIAAARPALTVSGAWSALLGESRAELTRALVSYVRERRWFRGKARELKHAAILDSVRTGDCEALVLLSIEYQQGVAERYAVPIACVSDARNDGRVPAVHAIATLTVTGAAGAGDVTGTLYDGAAVESFATEMMNLMTAGGSGADGRHGRLAGVAYPALGERPADLALTPRMSTAEQSNTSIIYGDRYMLKLFRVVADGPSTDLEISRFLMARGFAGVPRLAGAVEYHEAGKEPSTVGVLFEYVANQGDAWALSLDALDRYFAQVLTREPGPPPLPPAAPLVARAALPPDAQMRELIGAYLDRARLLGVATGELHAALSSDDRDPEFAVQPFTLMYQQSLHQSATALMARTFERLRARRDALPEAIGELAEAMLAREAKIDGALARVTQRPLGAVRIRAHGDFHLGQALWTGDRFVIIDFEGEPARPLSQRRFKRSPLRDVAGMLRSFDYAAEAALRDGRLRAEDVAKVAPWARAWRHWVSSAYLGGYLEALHGSRLLPSTAEEIQLLLDFYMLEKCIYEVGYELDNRPDWLEIPIRGLLALAEGGR
ncbi:MAG TPA: maltose alpha-D-glucosyltransferase [Kofleriaceae bacterium]|nr:maltose alpha-D-glucosyltransferase [Kofleriaceae bacterium]